MPGHGNDHKSVMRRETVDVFREFPGGIFLDGTVGAAGHAESILDAIDSIRRFYGIDQDEEALAIALERLRRFGDRVELIHGNFRSLDKLLPAGSGGRVGGILLDLGVSSMQLDRVERGFSFRNDAPIDMRMNRTSGKSAYEVINEYTEEELVRVLREWGEVRSPKAIARAIVRERGVEPIRDTGRFSRTVSRRIPERTRTKELARIYQAVRIEVNDELGSLREGLERSVEFLSPRGILAVLSYHSLEDRLVKTRFREWAKGCICPPDMPVCGCGILPSVSLPFRKAKMPTQDEIDRNGRARSARLRVAIRLEGERDPS